ncbi:MAG TPA: DUF1571 domain-containing protein [Paraburkholderia sp.]|jgi:hypothetical protein
MADQRTASPDLIADAQARFAALTNYEVMLRSTPADGEPVEVRYRYRKPGFVRVDFICPHAGAALLYSPETRKVLLWPFGFQTFPALTLSPDNLLIRGPSGHRIDRSDLGALLANVRKLQNTGDTCVTGDHMIGPHRATYLLVTGAADCAVDGVHRYQLWLDETTGLPVKVRSDDEHGEIETVWMDDLRIDALDGETFG